MTIFHGTFLDVPDSPFTGGTLRTADALLVRDGKLAAVGPRAKVEALPEARTAQKLDVGGRIVLPGFVDSHTHAVFAGTRADEFEWRIRGDSYMDILRRGGGILSSVKALRRATDLKVRFAERFLAHGTTTIEAP